MKKINQLVNQAHKEPKTSSLSTTTNSTQNEVVKLGHTYELKINAPELTTKQLAQIHQRLSAAFSGLTDERIMIILDRMKAHKMTPKEIAASINNVIDTCEYPEPAVASFIKSRKNIKLLTYSEYTNLQEGDHKNYEAIYLENNPTKGALFAHLKDIHEYGLTTMKEFKNQ